MFSTNPRNVYLDNLKFVVSLNCSYMNYNRPAKNNETVWKINDPEMSILFLSVTFLNKNDYSFYFLI